MQSLPWKKIAIGAVAIGIIALGIFYVTNSKGTKPGVTYVNPAFGEYISSFTSGTVSSGSIVRIVLSSGCFGFCISRPGDQREALFF